MITPEEENNKPQNEETCIIKKHNLNSEKKNRIKWERLCLKWQENKKGLYDKVQYEPFEIPEFFIGCFMFGVITIFIIIILSIIISRFMNLMENMKYLPIIIIVIVNFFCARYSFIAGRKSYGYGIITATILILLLTGPCFLYSNN